MEIPQKIRKILVVDDEPGICDIVAENLQILGYAPVRAYSGAVAIAAMDEHKPFHAAVVDIGMPDQDGWETLAHLRAYQPNLAAVMMSGFAYRDGTKGNDLSENVVTLNKPFSRDELQHALALLQADEPRG